MGICCPCFITDSNLTPWYGEASLWFKHTGMPTISVFDWDSNPDLPNGSDCCCPLHHTDKRTTSSTTHNRYLYFLFQTCHDELHTATCGVVKLEVLRQLTKLLRLVVDMVRGPASSHFTALSAINRIVDICVIHGAYHPWKIEDSSQPPGGTALNTPSPMETIISHGLHSSASRDGLPSSLSGSGFHQSVPSTAASGAGGGTAAGASGLSSSHSHSGLPTSCTKSSMMSSVFTDVNNSVHAQIENLIRGSPKIRGTGSPGKLRNSSWRSSSGRNQQDSVRSTRSGESSMRETSFMGGLSEECDSGITVGIVCDNTIERTPFELLFNSDPGPLITLLCTTIEKHKSTMGTRHKCTPSVRLRHCTHHCLQIMSARVLTVMCHR